MNSVIQHTKARDELPDIPALKTVSDPVTISENYADYLTDESNLHGGPIDTLLFAFSEKQVVEVLKESYRSKTPVTVSAGRTGIVGGAVPFGGTLLSLEKMDRFLGVRWDDQRECWCVRVEPGLTLDAFRKKLDSHDFQGEISRLEAEEQKNFQKFTQESGRWFYPVDPTEKTAHIGGTVAANASGARSYKYGATRNHVTALRIVLADGSVFSINRGSVLNSENDTIQLQKESETVTIHVTPLQMPQVKNAAGYFIQKPMDLIDLFIGSEGTLGVVTEVELALQKKPEFVLGSVAFFQSEKRAVHFVRHVQKEKLKSNPVLSPSALEYFDKHTLELIRRKLDREGKGSVIPEPARSAVFFEQEGEKDKLEVYCMAYFEILEQFGVSEKNTWGGIDPVEIGKMNDFRHAVPEEVNTIIRQRQDMCEGLHKIGTDFVVPENKLEQMMRIYKSTIEKEGLEYVIFGHIGESHLHVNMLPRNVGELEKAKALYLDLAKKAVAFGGTVSGEHGIGKIKKNMLAVLYSDEDILKMKSIKKALDPKGILNRGNLF